MGLDKSCVERNCPKLTTLTSCRYANLVGNRIALGIAEAGLFPGVVY